MVWSSTVSSQLAALLMLMCRQKANNKIFLEYFNWSQFTYPLIFNMELQLWWSLCGNTQRWLIWEIKCDCKTNVFKPTEDYRGLAFFYLVFLRKVLREISSQYLNKSKYRIQQYRKITIMHGLWVTQQYYHAETVSINIYSGNLGFNI